jgi:hypothetical protein
MAHGPQSCPPLSALQSNWSYNLDSPITRAPLSLGDICHFDFTYPALWFTLLGILILFSSWDFNSKTKKQQENIVLSIQEKLVTDSRIVKLKILENMQTQHNPT